MEAIAAKTVYRIVGGLFALAALIITTAAITHRPATLTGRVTLNGRPVIWGSVLVVAHDGRSAAGRIEPDGTYTVTDAPVGEVTISVSSPDPLVQHYATQIKTSRERIPVSQWAALPVDRKQWFLIPKRYEDAKTSGLTMTLGHGSNKQDIALVP